MTFDMGPEPQWLTCECGGLSARVPCWECDRAAMAKTDAARERALSAGSIPRRFEWAELEAPSLVERVKLRRPNGDRCVQQREFVDAGQRVLAAQRVVFVGPSGSGKSSLACACLRRRIPHGLWLSALRLGTARIQHSAGDGEAALVARAMAVPLLLLDEVGGETKTATNAVRDVLFARHDADLPTWITTGFSSQQLAETYGDGAVRRITEGAYVVKLG